jgi:CheY-like chemotaxis protein
LVFNNPTTPLRIEATFFEFKIRFAHGGDTACQSILPGVYCNQATCMTESEATRTQTPPGVKPLIYVVDDEAMLLELAAVILEPLGFDVVSFCDPDAALQAFATGKRRPVLLITDYAMHSMNGMQLLEQCRRLEPRQKILLLSGTVGPEIFHQAASRPDQFLAKPYHARQLIEVVSSMLCD